MKRLIFAMMAVALLTSCNFHVEKTVSDSTEVTRYLTGFERIAMMGSLDVKYMQADSFSVKVQGSTLEQIMKVETTVEGNVLKVNMKNSSNFLQFGSNDADDITVYVTSPDFLGVSLMGSGDFQCEQPLDTDTLSIELRGSGDIRFADVICDHVNASLIGSGDVSVDKIQTQQAKLNVIGSGDIKVRFDNSGAVEAVVKGSGDIDLQGGIRKLTKTVHGSGDINYDGE